MRYGDGERKRRFEAKAYPAGKQASSSELSGRR